MHEGGLKRHEVLANILETQKEGAPNDNLYQERCSGC